MRRKGSATANFKSAEQATLPGLPKHSALYDKALEYVRAKRAEEKAKEMREKVGLELVREFKDAKVVEIDVTDGIMRKKVRYDHIDKDKIVTKDN